MGKEREEGWRTKVWDSQRRGWKEQRREKGSPGPPIVSWQPPFPPGPQLVTHTHTHTHTHTRPCGGRLDLLFLLSSPSRKEVAPDAVGGTFLGFAHCSQISPDSW